MLQLDRAGRRGSVSSGWGLGYPGKLCDREGARSSYVFTLSTNVCSVFSACTSLSLSLLGLRFPTYWTYPALTGYPGGPVMPLIALPNHITLGVIFQLFWVTFLNSLATQGLPLRLRMTYFSFWFECKRGSPWTRAIWIQPVHLCFKLRRYTIWNIVLEQLGATPDLWPHTGPELLQNGLLPTVSHGLFSSYKPGGLGEIKRL